MDVFENNYILCGSVLALLMQNYSIQRWDLRAYQSQALDKWDTLPICQNL